MTGPDPIWPSWPRRCARASSCAAVLAAATGRGRGRVRRRAAPPPTCSPTTARRWCCAHGDGPAVAAAGRARRWPSSDGRTVIPMVSAPTRPGLPGGRRRGRRGRCRARIAGRRRGGAGGRRRRGSGIHRAARPRARSTRSPACPTATASRACSPASWRVRSAPAPASPSRWSTSTGWRDHNVPAATPRATGCCGWRPSASPAACAPTTASAGSAATRSRWCCRG